MTRYVFLVGALTSLVVTLASVSYAATNLNSSRSNIYRLVYPPVVTAAQATAILAELDKVKPGGDVDEATVRGILQKHVGAVKSARSQKLIIIIRPSDGPRKLKSILILENAADEPQAIAVSDEGVSSSKGKKSTK